MRAAILTTLILLFGITFTDAYAQRSASPRGEAATQIGGAYEGGDYSGGKWIVVDYGRPILRGRTNIFGEGESRGEKVNGGAPVWRAGANKSTRLMTEADLQFGEHTLPAGEYSLFVDLGSDSSTLILSSHGAKSSYREDTEGLWGSYNYTPDKDVLRVAMDVGQQDRSVDQFTIGFVNMTQMGGTLALMWEHAVMTADFSLSQ